MINQRCGINTPNGDCQLILVIVKKNIHQTVIILTSKVVKALTRRIAEGTMIHIEDIQDQVELALMRDEQHKVARAYVLYREQQAAQRYHTNKLKKEIGGKVSSMQVIKRDGNKELGGLHILGTERHESRRIDLQLRGRSGRQGDAGSSQFYLSLEDDLMRLFNSERVASITDRMGIEEGEVITHKMVTRAIQNAQKKVEGRNFGIRKHLLEYDDVMNQQRQVVYDIRNQALSGENMQESVFQILDDFILDEADGQSESGTPDLWDWDHLKQCFASHTLVDASLEKIQNDIAKTDLTFEEICNRLADEAKSVYKARESLLPEDVIRGF